MNRSPILFSFCSPAGGGKSTICGELSAADPLLRRSISTTTRKPRGAEVDGTDYFFVDQAEFDRRVDAGLFVEHARFGGSCYGTEVRNVELAEQSAADLLLAIDVQGAASLKQRFPAQAVTVCVFPPSAEILEERLRMRGTESDVRIRERLAIAQEELRILSTPGFSDYFLLNDELGKTVLLAQAIIAAERQRFSRFDPQYLTKLFNS